MEETNLTFADIVEDLSEYFIKLLLSRSDNGVLGAVESPLFQLVKNFNILTIDVSDINKLNGNRVTSDNEIIVLLNKIWARFNANLIECTSYDREGKSLKDVDRVIEFVASYSSDLFRQNDNFLSKTDLVEVLKNNKIFLVVYLLSTSNAIVETSNAVVTLKTKGRPPKTT